MDIALSSIISLYVFSTGRRLYAFQQVLKAAQAISFGSLEAHLLMAIEHDKQTRGLDAQWAKTPATPTGAVDVKGVDAQVDRALTALRDGAQTEAEAATPGDGIPEKVAAFLLELFPEGVQKVTSMVYIDELSAVDRIVERLEGDLAPTVTELNLQRKALRLAALAKEYRAALEAPAPSTLNFSVVRAAREKGQEHLLQTVAIILGKYFGNVPSDLEARAALLGPILKQNDAIRQYLRMRRPIEDIDPETGEVDPGAPPSTPEGQGGNSPPA